MALLDADNVVFQQLKRSPKLQPLLRSDVMRATPALPEGRACQVAMPSGIIRTIEFKNEKDYQQVKQFLGLKMDTLRDESTDDSSSEDSDDESSSSEDEDESDSDSDDDSESDDSESESESDSEEDSESESESETDSSSSEEETEPIRKAKREPHKNSLDKKDKRSNPKNRFRV